MHFSRDKQIVTVLGGGGFVGRYVCEALAKEGVRIRVAQRDPRRAFFLQPLGTVGQIGLIAADMLRPASIERAIEGATAVINLVGVFKGDLDAIHVEGARTAAKAAASTGSSAFVQVSAIGADPSSPSDYGRTKGEGEAAVREAFPGATIIRPSILFGAEDDFTNRFASMARLPVMPVVAASRRFQPAWVRDVARAIAAAALDPQHYGGKTFELAGPRVMTMREMIESIAAMAGLSPSLVDLPDVASGAIASFGFLPGAPLTRDQWLMLQRDNVAGPSATGFEAFGISPAAMDAVARDWLQRFLPGGRFAPRPTASEYTA